MQQDGYTYRTDITGSSDFLLMWDLLVEGGSLLSQYQM